MVLICWSEEGRAELCQIISVNLSGWVLKWNLVLVDADARQSKFSCEQLPAITASWADKQASNQHLSTANYRMIT